MFEKRLLIIDDKDQSEEIESICKTLRGNGIDLVVESIILNSSEFLNQNGDYLIEKITNHICAVLRDKGPFDLILSDYQLDIDDFSGIDVVKLIRKSRKNVHIVVA